ncbi:UDP-2,3-diacylglucosamine diphosphatase [Spirosoma utsteinense]|uniref:UDP-2,3-diacylglucosamine pyrophosphatase LpxH n=1 Tax=Spirosoma utsteinense TaxID=2585773 RepID=A0ABR6W4U7_9BACT|nr:UDP-2,3-diacylglucosamine diphosphatase [Spirosoma utsteinense]MBC3785479.1 UDP-2,3-diacylglucosamine pyrophosphatase LpxH [Spirosoma utsteinense]MBC3791492.1 UDP-2,3-diacylglucosamine pyrophosphatase LpxH [Spirosoma utsteinense]
MKSSTQFRTIVLSDIHLGTTGSKAKEVTEFLQNYSCQKLILNGDIIDGWQLKQYGTWKKKHTAFFKTVLKQIVHYDTKVVYLRGNHDDFLDQVMPMKVGKNFSIRKDYTLTSGTKKFYVTHGDVFDSITSHMKWLAYLGDIGYTFLLWVNKFYNQYRAWRGLPYYSLSQQVKSRIKQAVSYISDYEQKLTELARARNCDGVICGHIHQPALHEFNGIIYMNSGDWVESLSALVEDHEGNWSLLYYTSDLSEEDAEKKALKKVAKQARQILKNDSPLLRAD